MSYHPLPLKLRWSYRRRQGCWLNLSQRYQAGGWFNKKMPSYQYRNSHCGDKTILRPSYLHNGISYTGKTTSLYWIRPQISSLRPEYSGFSSNTQSIHSSIPQLCNKLWTDCFIIKINSEVLPWDLIRMTLCNGSYLLMVMSWSMMTSSNGNIFRVTGHLCGEFTGHMWIPTLRSVTRSVDVFFYLCLYKRLSKQWWGWWFETPSCPLWCHCNATIQVSARKSATMMTEYGSFTGLILDLRPANEGRRNFVTTSRNGWEQT